jgi:competence protein ComFC
MLCINCKKELNAFHSLICINCWSEIKFIKRQNIFNHATVEYNHTIQRLIHIFKYQSPWMLCDLFINWLSLIYEDIINGADIIIPVPIHKYKMMKRGYNQVAILAKKLAKKYNKPCLLNILTKSHSTISQSSLNKYERQTNVIGSFQINPKKVNKIKNKKILLIDDVITTGATLLECTKVLKQSGINEIQTLCIAMTKYE